MSMIASIVRKKVGTKALLNLAVGVDESFVANGIVVHNCKSRLVPNAPGEAKVTGIAINAPDTEERARLEKQITLGCC